MNVQGDRRNQADRAQAVVEGLMKHQTKHAKCIMKDDTVIADGALFTRLIQHVGHDVAVVFYGKGGKRRNAVNASVECEDCNEVLVSADREGVS